MMKLYRLNSAPVLENNAFYHKFKEGCLVWAEEDHVTDGREYTAIWTYERDKNTTVMLVVSTPSVQDGMVGKPPRSYIIILLF